MMSAIQKESTVVAIPVDDVATTPRRASKRLAVFLLFGLFAFVAVFITTPGLTGGRVKMKIECKDVLISSLVAMGIPTIITEPRYQLVVRNFNIPLPPELTWMFSKGGRCPEP